MIYSRIAVLADVADKGIRFRCAGRFLLRSTSRMFVWCLVACVNGVSEGCWAGRAGAHGECELSICCAED
jgi:hypothetical protein